MLPSRKGFRRTRPDPPMTLSIAPETRVPSFYGLTRPALAARLAGFGLPAYRADQLFAWVYRKHHRSPAGMSNLPAALREGFGAICDLALPRVASCHGTADGDTHKFVLELADGARVECVSMRTERRLTYCLSSQVGCALKCSFCATGLMGLKRNLRAEEIVAQVMLMGDHHRWQDDRFNLVFMGMGEPLANLRHVADAIRVFHDPAGLNLGARRITVSTSGLVPQIEELADLGLPVGLALSLHATTDALRDELVPVNKRWPLAELIPAVRNYGRRSGRRVTLEYTLIAGVNDSMEDADRLATLARELPSKINIIPYNPVPGLDYRRPSPQAIEAFERRLWPKAPAVTVRNTMGGEIWAACGQLGGLTPDELAAGPDGARGGPPPPASG
jgi:23S rRNA (adenine2503-C2)-methyltransferase